MTARRTRKRARRDAGKRQSSERETGGAQAGASDAPGQPGGQGSWADELGDVRPLDGRHERVQTPAPSPRAKPERPARFHLPDPGEPGLGFALGISNATRKQLQQGRIPPERRIDLHGLTRDEARRECTAGLRDAIAAGERCVLVVHGKGLRSAEGPVLRKALPEWLADPSLEGRVLAFAPARPEDGGAGASYVLLRRKRGAG